MKERTYCPYCGTANLTDKQKRIAESGIVFVCHFCKNVFTDLSITNGEQNQREQIEELSTN